MEDCIEGADIITAAASGHTQPEIKDEWLKEGCLIMLTGAAKLSDHAYLEGKIVVDDWKMHKATAKEFMEWEVNQSQGSETGEQAYLGMGGQIFKLVMGNG